MSDIPGEGESAGRFRALHKVEDIFLALLLGAMIVLAPLQIFLRNFFDSGIGWVDPFLRVLVLWVGLMGAVAASRADRHIRIDVASKLLSPRLAALLAAVTSLFTATVAGLVAWHSGRFVTDEWEFGSTAFSGVPAWMFEAVIPMAFGIIALRYGVRTFVQLKAILAGDGGGAPTAPDSSSGSAS
jgi:TRAP-type C4-dicarboxylate transport system permease small subunit